MVFAALLILSVATGPASAQTRASTPSERGSTVRRVVAKVIPGARGQLTYQLPDQSRVSCQATRERIFDCSSLDARGRTIDHGDEIWFVRIGQGSLAITAVGRRPVPRASIPGSRPRDVSRVAAMVAARLAREEEEDRRRQALFEEAQHVDYVCEMCNWSGGCWTVPCILPPTKD